MSTGTLWDLLSIVVWDTWQTSKVSPQQRIVPMDTMISRLLLTIQCVFYLIVAIYLSNLEYSSTPWALTRYLKWLKRLAQRRWDRLSVLFVARMANAQLFAIRINMRIPLMKPAPLATHFAEVAMFQVRPLLEVSILLVLTLAHSALELQVCQWSIALQWATVLANLGSIMTQPPWSAKHATQDVPNATDHPICNA